MRAVAKQAADLATKRQRLQRFLDFMMMLYDCSARVLQIFPVIFLIVALCVTLANLWELSRLC